MTANQVAYGNMQVNQSMAEETQRHNQVMEDLSERQLELDRLKVDNENWYKQEMVRLQQTSIYTEQDRLHLEAQKADEQKRYQTTSNQIQWEQAYISKALADEKVRSNLAQESLTNQSISLNQKRLEFEKYQFDTEFSWNQALGTKKYELDVRKAQNEYNIGTESNRIKEEALNIDRLSYGLRADQLNLDMDKWNWTQETWSKEYDLKKAALTKDAVFGVMPYVLPNASSIVSGALKLISQ